MEDKRPLPLSLILPPLPLLLLLLLDGVRALSTTANKTTPKVPALLVFGDSIVDPGNNNVLPTFARCNFPPYGKDFPGGKATGRFSNGKNPSDILASQIGVKEYVPAYLGTHLDAQELLTGISFASGGCGYDPLTSQLLVALSLRHQLTLFKEYKEKLKRVAGEGRAADIIADSLYAVATGTNDIATTYFLLPFRREEFDIPSYITFLVRSASSFLQELYHSGARRIAIMGAPPIGCMPSQRTLAGGIERESRIVYIDIYTSLLDMILRPFAYGFKESTRGCCGTGYYEVIITCNSLTATTCANASEYVFWDSFHPTERAAEIIITQVLQQYGASLLD
ncbi:hypothetical protein BHM03_00054924 [Ensete ventricosum]|nr:hypothetical protein BHM03_00054924 [Ensete ventricosum]